MSGKDPDPADRLHAASGELEPGLLAELTRALLPYLGPYSITTVKRASRNTRDGAALVELIAGHIDDPVKRQAFAGSAARILDNYGQVGTRLPPPPKVAAKPVTGPIASAARPGTPITGDMIQRGETALAHIIGPLAGVLVQRYAKATDNSRDFFDRLAAHLRTPEEKHSFFEQVRTAEGAAHPRQ